MWFCKKSQYLILKVISYFTLLNYDIWGKKSLFFHFGFEICMHLIYFYTKALFSQVKKKKNNRNICLETGYCYAFFVLLTWSYPP